MHELFSRTWIPAAMSLLILLWAAPVFAHKVTIFAWVEGDLVHTESKFSAGKPVQNGKIEVYDRQNRILLQGTTDDQGHFDFPVPQKSALKIVLVAGLGHSNHWTVRAEEIDTVPDRQRTPDAAQTFQSETEAVSSTAPTASPGACVDADTVRKIVTLALEKKLAPLEARLANQRWQWREIIAGIGYILGLMGLASYMRYRKQK